MEKPIRVRIHDNEYLVKTDEDEKLVRNIAEFVNGKFKEIKNNTEGLSERKTAIMVAFDIASEYFQLLNQRDSLVKDIQERVRALNYQIDSVLK